MIAAILLGIGLSASAGYRVFIPLLIASIAGKMGWIPLTESFEWMGSTYALICFGTAAVVEIAAYYIPVVDNLLDTVTTPMALVAGTLLTTSVLPIDQDLLKWVTGIMVGGGSAGIIQMGTSMLRLASTKTTAGAGNPVVATAEHGLALGQSIMAILLPVITGFLVLLFLLFLVSKLIRLRQ
jgi:hypothetical protein